MSTRADLRAESVATTVALVTAWLSADGETIAQIMEPVLADRDAVEMLALSGPAVASVLLRLVAHADGATTPEEIRKAALARLRHFAPLIALGFEEVTAGD